MNEVAIVKEYKLYKYLSVIIDDKLINNIQFYKSVVVSPLWFCFTWFYLTKLRINVIVEK